MTQNDSRPKETCDDWTKIPLHCAECGAQFLRKVRHQTYCEEHRHMAGTVIKPVEQPPSNPIDVSTHGPDGHWDYADVARLCALRDRQAQEIGRLTSERNEAHSELCRRIEQEPLKYAQMTAQFRAQAEAVSVLLAECDSLRAALERVLDEVCWPDTPGFKAARKAAREALGASPASKTEKEHG